MCNALAMGSGPAKVLTTNGDVSRAATAPGAAGNATFVGFPFDDGASDNADMVVMTWHASILN
jgi:hypothetical protein